LIRCDLIPDFTKHGCRPAQLPGGIFLRQVMARIALGIEYDGSGFCGWQTQPSGCAVQDVLERALAEVAGHAVSTICAGRTDAGVHAAGQVVHFDSNAERPESAWIRGVNAHLPDAVAVQWMQAVSADFHARFGALERRYRYVLLDHPVRPALNRNHVGWIHQRLQLEPMRLAAAGLLGEHDFSAFRAAECQAESPVRVLRQLNIERCGDYVVFDFVANAFLHHMVRNIVGSLVYVGAGRQAPEWMRELLAVRDRTKAAPTFSAAGLYLSSVRYDAKYTFPDQTRRIWFNLAGS
jgi:tRNA pseudouridine38-40 synthase